MTDTTADAPAAPLVSWHPPRADLELVELVATGLLERLPRPPALPADVAERVAAGHGLLVEDAEGTPVAVLRPHPAGATDPTGATAPGGAAAPTGATAPGASPAQEGAAPAPAMPHVECLRPFAHGPLRRHRRGPAEVAGDLAARGRGPVTAVVVGRPPTTDEVTALVERTAREGARLLWFVLVGEGWAGGMTHEAAWRATRATARDAEARGAAGVVVPLAVPRIGDGGRDVRLLEVVAGAYGASEVLTWTAGEAGVPVGPHPAWARELRRAERPPHRRGVAILFTGLSGSGKSTVAKALADRLREDGRREVSVLDGDEVRRLLSAGLGFGRADRDLNIRRIGFVAGEIVRHGGIAICAPIAPFASVRAEVRAMAEATGDFLLVHVSTPLAECERRDRKGLYAKARQGLVPEFTGISSPYEEPEDADLRIDTSRMSVEEAVDRLWVVLEERGYLEARG